MRNLEWYMDEAKTRAGIKSDKKLSEFLGLSHVASNYWRHGRAFPTDETMIRLAQMAGIDPWVALLDLNSWRSEGLAKKAYEGMLQKFVSAIAVIVLTGIFLIIPAQAHAQSMNELALLPHSGVLCKLNIITFKARARAASIRRQFKAFFTAPLHIVELFTNNNRAIA